VKRGCCNKNAQAIIAAILIIMIASVMGLCMVSLLGADIGTSLNYMRSQQAFFISESGLQYYLKKLNDQTSSWVNPPAKPVNAPLANGSFTITTTNAQANSIDVGCTANITTIGTETVTRVLSVHATRQIGVPAAFKYVQHCGSDIRFTGSTQGIITGDISAVDKVIDESGMTINGTITEGSTVTMPTVDFASYQAIANYVISGNYTFQTGQIYNGIYYITGNVTFQSGVTLNGSVIAPSGNKSVSLNSSSNINITPSGNYPAIVAAGNITMTSATGMAINGLVFSQKTIDLRYLTSSNFNGCIVGQSNMDIRNTRGVNFTYNSNIASNPPPYFGGGTQSVVAENWNEVY
jgi:hypothetical protein